MGRHKQLNKIGECSINKYGSKMKIIEYHSSYDVLVQFENNYKIKVTYGNFLKGNVSNPYDKTIHGIGFIGEGIYKVSENGKATKFYSLWRNMLDRCYNKLKNDNNPSYKNCAVCEDWYCFQNFAKWAENNYYKIEGEKTHLDKDILKKDNKLYSPENCIFVPESINTLFTKCNRSRGECPLGVHHYKYKGTDKYLAKISKRKTREHLGLFNTIEEAFNAYKLEKEKYIKQIAEEYKNKIPTKLYNALITYKVEITD